MRRKLFAGMMVFLAAVVPVVGSVKVGATEQPVAAGVVVGEDKSGNKEASDGETVAVDSNGTDATDSEADGQDAAVSVDKERIFLIRPR